jgi:predicted adenylyl cyclase CyaB
MAHQDIEIEIKLSLYNPAAVKAFLMANAQLVVENVYQKDVYFTPAHRDFLGVQYPFEWLRLRESAKGVSINYKHFHPENVKKTDYCDEYETPVGNLESMKKIFASLDIREVVTVEKVRSTWEFEQVEIMIDEVSALGSFIELEATTSFDSPQAGKESLYAVLAKLGAETGEESLRGYPYMILENQGYEFGE